LPQERLQTVTKRSRWTVQSTSKCLKNDIRNIFNASMRIETCFPVFLLVAVAVSPCAMWVVPQLGQRWALHAQERDGVCRHRMYCCGCARSPGWSTCGGDVTTKWNSKVGTPALCFLGKWV